MEVSPLFSIIDTLTKIRVSYLLHVLGLTGSKNVVQKTFIAVLESPGVFIISGLILEQFIRNVVGNLSRRVS